jgi:ribosomal protein S21
MSVNAEVTRTGNETALATIRKFSRRVQGTGLIKSARKRRYFARDASKIVKKKHALKVLKRRADYRQKVKEGKIIEQAPRHSYQERRAPQQEQKQGLESTPIAR